MLFFQATWRYPFYGKDKKTPGGGMVNCMALPLSHLPENVHTALGTKFGGGDLNATSPNPAEAAPRLQNSFCRFSKQFPLAR